MNKEEASGKRGFRRLQPHEKALYGLCLVIFPMMVCSGMVYSILPLYISGELGASLSSIGILYMVGAASGFLFAPYLGRLSDKLGRKQVLLMSLVVFAFAFAVYGFLRNFNQAFPVYALEGASWAALGATAHAFIADIVPVESRGWAMGVYERTWALGWMIGPPLGAFLAEVIGFRITFILGGVITAAAALYYGLRKPERT